MQPLEPSPSRPPGERAALPQYFRRPNRRYYELWSLERSNLVTVFAEHNPSRAARRIARDPARLTTRAGSAKSIVAAMSTPPSKRPPSSERDESPPAAEGLDESDGSGGAVSATDSDPAGRLLHHLRDRGERAATPAASFGPGSRVSVLRGTFAGKSGVVQELDGRGGARVQLGTLSARIDLGDLAAEVDPATPRERLTLSSSHRKPR